MGCNLQWLVKVALVAGFIVLPICVAASAHAGPNSSDDSALVMQEGLWDQKYLLGDWGGARSWLAERGVTFDLNNIGDFQADVTGGQAHHAAGFYGKMPRILSVSWAASCRATRGGKGPSTELASNFMGCSPANTALGNRIIFPRTKRFRNFPT